MLQSMYDLTTVCHKTTGDVPPPLVGASTTVVGSKVYIFGGRVVKERKMVSDMYVFDMETYRWEKIPTYPDDDVPRARYFHSADTWNNKLIIFGGMHTNQLDPPNNSGDLGVLNDVRFFDIATRHWLPNTTPSTPPGVLPPRARYAHLSSVTADRLFIIGGQNFDNTWLDDVCVYDLVAKTWTQRRDYPGHCGTYRSLAVASPLVTRFPQEEIRASQSASTLGPPGQRFGPDSAAHPTTEFTPSESLVHLPYSAPPTEEHPSEILLYSNYNFTDVKRELEVFSPLPEQDFTIQDKSSMMTGSHCPPGLRFPTGAILGTHLIIAGTYLAHTHQSFAVWALDLNNMQWTRLDIGRSVDTGSWFRGCLYPEASKFFIFGNRNGNLIDDYNRRLLSWDHIAVVDLETFGIYLPPPHKLDIPMQELGLAALEERVVADFDIICEDGRRISCSRKILEERWPWFLEQRKIFNANVTQALTHLPDSPAHLPMPEIPGNASSEDPRVDPRLTARAFELSEPYPIVLALLQYFYSTALITPLQHAPAVLSQLLVLANNYNLKHLETLVKHAMHRALSNSTSVGVYEVATLCNCRSLQMRALATVMNYTKARPSRSRGRDRDNGNPPGGAGGPPDGGPGPGPGAGGPGNGNGNDSQPISRPRGTSDARWRTMGSDSSVNGAGSGYNTRPALAVDQAKLANVAREAPSPVDSTYLANNPRPRSIARWRSDPVLRDTTRRNVGLMRPSTAETQPNLTHAKNPSIADLNYLADLMGVPSTQELESLAIAHDSESDAEVVPSEEDYGRQDTPVPFATKTVKEDSNVPVPTVAVVHDDLREDQITPLPVLRAKKSQRRGRTPSIVSIHTELEMHELVDFLSATPALDAASLRSPANDEGLVEHSPSIITPEIAYSSRSNRSSFSPSVAPSLSASILTAADSEHSDGVADKHESLSLGSVYHRNRPPRIYTDSMQSVTPSLVSSTSASNSSLSASRFASPSSPVTSSSELLSPTDLAIIDERFTFDTDVAVAELDTADPFNTNHMSFFIQDYPVKNWPKQRSNIKWTPLTSPTPMTPTSPSLALPPTNAAHSTTSLATSSSSSGTSMVEPQSPRTPGSTSAFGRLLGRKKDSPATLVKDKGKEKKLKEQEKAKAKEKERLEKERRAKETPEEKKARLEQARKERLRKALMAEPSMMGGMMAIA